jgi:hypothetical protein
MKYIQRNGIRKEYFLGFMVMMLLISATMPAKRTLKEIALQKQAEGKFIAVYLQPAKLMYAGVGDQSTNYSNLGNICSMDGKAPIKDQFGNNYTASMVFDEKMPESYSLTAKNFADQLNEGLGVTSFKAVFPADLPMKTVKFFAQEEQAVDWTKTEYDVMVSLIAAPVYTTHLSVKNYYTDYQLSMLLYINELVPGKDALGYIGSGHNLATVKSNSVSHDGCLKSLDELKQKVADPGMFSEKFYEANKADFTKFIEKENKKYEKSVK